MKNVPLTSVVTMGVALCALTHSTYAQWTVTLLEPAGANQSKAFGAHGGRQCGFVNYTGQGSATIWQGTPESVVDISQGQTWISSAANAISGDQVVVSGLGGSMGMTAGYLYSISANNFINLSPPWSASTAMQGCYAGTNTQVGSGQQMMGAMLMWNGTPGSVVNLTPPGWVSSAAAGCAGDTQVGNGLPGFMGFGHPFLTHGSAASFVDLTPPGSTSAGVAACDLDSQVGSVLWPSSMMGHACIWHGTAASCVDLHPFNAASSAATACWGGKQIGNYVPSIGGFGQAVVWQGTAASAQDLHQFVVDQLGPQYVSTEALGIDPITGDIVGNAYTLVGPYMIPHAIMWQAGPTVVCNDIDFNNDGSLFDPQDIDAFLSVYAEGPCIPETATCDDIDFNNDTSIFDPCDIDSFLQVFSEGPCSLCGE